MAFFKNFPIIKYRFGSNEEPVFFKDLSSYVDLVDKLSDQVSFYQNITIVDGDRPDTLSYKLYGTSDYYWTFFLLNDNLKEQGWPLTTQRVYDYSEELYPDYAIQVDGQGSSAGPGGILKDSVASTLVLAQAFTVGQLITVTNSSAQTCTAKVVRKNLDIGQMILRYVSGTEAALLNIELMEYTDGGSGSTFSIGNDLGAFSANFFNNVVEYNAPSYYKNSSGDRIDINAYDIATSTSGQVPVTYQENLIESNDALKIIKVFKTDVISDVVSEFNRLIKG